MPIVDDEQALGAMLRLHFSLFLAFAFAELGGGRPLLGNWHIDAIEHQLDRVRHGDLNRLIITMPPRHLKSITVSTVWVAWMLGKDPSIQFMCVSYGEKLALKHASDCLRIMSTDWYAKAFPNVKITRRQVLDIETSAGGGRISTSTSGAITGRGADIILLDDPMKADDAMSETAREQVASLLHTTLLNRADDAERGVFILIMQRLHQADLAGELIEKGGWHELRLSAIATQDEVIPLTRGRHYQRRAGGVLHPERQSKAFLMKRRADDSYVFAAQFQQDPVAPEGAFLKASWFKTYDEPPQSGIVVQSWDTAVKKTVRSDWSVGITARFYMGKYYILDVFRERVSFGELKAQLRSSCQRFKVDRLLIEDASSGQSLIQDLRDEPCTGVPRPIPVTPKTDKVTRFEAQASKIEAGVVVLPHTAPWKADFVKEVVSFPGVAHDDQADALAQMLANSPPSPNIIPNAYPIIVWPRGDGPDERLSYDDDEYEDPWAAR